MTTPEERDYINEVIREDAAERKGIISVMNSAGEEFRFNPDDATISFGSINAELRQQLADVSNERDGLRAQLSGPTPGQMLEIGANYWNGRQNLGIDNGAVKWVQDTETGALFVYTRGEYADVLKNAIMSLEAQS